MVRPLEMSSNVQIFTANLTAKSAVCSCCYIENYVIKIGIS